jgi:hypothetical protein
LIGKKVLGIGYKGRRVYRVHRVYRGKKVLGIWYKGSTVYRGNKIYRGNRGIKT